MLLIIKLKIIYIITSETTEQIKTEQTIKNDGGAEEREKARVRVEFRAWPRVEVRGKCQKDKLKDSPHDRTYVMECFVGFVSWCAPFVCPLSLPAFQSACIFI